MMLPSDGRVLLNAGTMSPTPRAVFEAGIAIRELQASNPHRFFNEQQGQFIDRARKSLAQFLHVEPVDLFLLPNVTIAMNFAIHAIECAVREKRIKRDTILISSVEYGSIALKWRSHAVLRVEIVPIHHCRTWDEIVAAFASRMNKRTAAICISHVAQPTGRVLPIRTLTDLARKNGALSVIDGAHAPGLLPLDLKALGADAYGANVHKWMMGLANSGFLHVSQRMKEMLQPVFVSWGSQALRDDNRNRYAPFFGGTQLQGAIEFWGCVDRVPQMVLPATIAFLKQVGFMRARSRMKDLSQQVKDEVGKTLTPLVFHDPETQYALTAFELPVTDRAAVRIWFGKRKIEIGATRLREDVEGRFDEVLDPRDRQVYLRVSTGWYNTEGEIARLADAVKKWKRTHG